jgi:hypothetical protein
MERGLVLPPRSPEILKTYAGALKLDAEDSQTLQALAIQESLPTGFRTVQKRPQGIEPWVSATDVEAWADLIPARSDFPRLIRRLIHATSDAPTRVDFPAGEGSQRKGWDGIVDLPTPTINGTAGRSVWELGVGADPAGKAESDFRARTKNPLGQEPSETTFVFVTARRWHGKAKWESEKNALGLWKEVRVLDADSLEAWLELAPAVDIWFARLIGKRPEGVLDLDEYWKNLSATTDPRLTPDIFLTSRATLDIPALKAWLGIATNDDPDAKAPAAPAALAVESSSPSDAIDFLAAFIANLDEPERDALNSRIVVVEDKKSWNALCDHQQSLTLVARPGIALEAEGISQAVRKGHRVFVASDRFAPGQFQLLKLSRPDVFELGTALINAGFDEDKARKEARHSSGSLTVLKRRLSKVPATSEPAWARSELASKLAPLVLIGSWEDVSSADNDIVSQITGSSYADIATLASQATMLPDPPMYRIRGLCSLTSREDSWALLARYLRHDQLQAWEDVAVRVLTGDDATPRPRRISRRAATRSETFSEALRTGIAETLVLLSVFPKELEPRLSIDYLAERVVQRALGNTPGWKRWHALQQQLPLLAEAAPDTFLNALEAELRIPEGDILDLFADTSGEFHSPCRHAGLLWALETLAWHPSYLSRVSLVLAELAERDTGKRWSNRPYNSLAEIFLPWLPHTAARVDERIAILKNITEKHANAGWRLLLELLPSHIGNSMPTHTPKWRDWASNWRYRADADADYARQTQACGQRLVEMVGNDKNRWSDLIKHIARIPEPSRQAALAKLTSLDLSNMRSDDRKDLAEKLRAQVQRHRSFPDAWWVLPKEDIELLETALAHIEPEDLISRSEWLFAHHVELPEPHGPDWDWRHEEEKVSKMRKEAIATIFAQDSIRGIKQLANAVKAPDVVGVELATLHIMENEDALLPSSLLDPNTAIAGLAWGYVRKCFDEQSWEWVESLDFKRWSPDQLARLGAILDAEQRTWDLLGRNGDEAVRIYWETTIPRWIKEPSDLQYAIYQLIEHKRPFAAISALDWAHKDLGDLPADILLKSLEATLQPDIDKPAKDMGFSIIRILQDLQKREPTVDQQRLATLEWAFIGLLDGDQASASTLHNALATDAESFSQLIRLIFRPRSETDTPPPKLSERESNNVMNAYRLLHSWETIPGTQKDTQAIDGDFLMKWIDQARKTCAESGHLEICDSQIGQVFAHSAEESDGTWPCVPVRDAIEAIDSQDIAGGFVVGALNRQGVTVRMPTAGGTIERTESSKYTTYAAACETEWPVTAAILRRIADIYEKRARDEDADAEMARRGRW